MKILQLTSDWKWTGPAAPMVQLAAAQRDAGHEVALVCAPAPPESEPSLRTRAIEAGFPPAVELSRSRGVRLWRDRADTAALRDLIETRGFDVVHTWHTRDHVLALRAAARRRRQGRTRVVRAYKIAEPIPPLPWNRWLFGPGTDGLQCVSQASADANARLRGGRPTAAVYGAIDLERFRPAPADKAVRESLGLSPEDRVVGIVARAQRHRRFDLLLEAAARRAAEDPSFRLVVVGRGTHIEETAQRPAEALGIADRVVFAGYRTDDFVDVLRCFDVFTFLVPGSDGGCRALLEAQACGLPAVTSRRGALPELIADGETGFHMEEDAAALADAWGTLLDDAALRQRFGAAARARAEAEFSPARLEARVAGLYAATGAGS
ncbi:MAG: glycosyltransferase family 4 protein [Myxococcota bacterium]